MNNQNLKKRIIINKIYKAKLLQRTSGGFSVQTASISILKTLRILVF